MLTGALYRKLRDVKQFVQGHTASSLEPQIQHWLTDYWPRELNCEVTFKNHAFAGSSFIQQVWPEPFCVPDTVRVLGGDQWDTCAVQSGWAISADCSKLSRSQVSSKETRKWVSLRQRIEGNGGGRGDRRHPWDQGGRSTGTNIEELITWQRQEGSIWQEGLARRKTWWRSLKIDRVQKYGQCIRYLL